MKLNNNSILSNISKFSLGTMTFGEQTNKLKAFEIMDYSYENGINFFDTAEMYPVYPKKKTQGDSEKIIGEWLKLKKNKNKIVIGTKISTYNPNFIGSTKLKWIREGSKNLKYDKKNVTKAIEDSLTRLNIESIDLCQLHWPERNVPFFGKFEYEHNSKDYEKSKLENIIFILNKLINEGKIKSYGISNETPWGMMKYISISKENNLRPPESIQNVYNLLNRGFDISHSEVSMRENFGLLAYSPLACGRLSGKYLNRGKPKGSRYDLWPGRFDRHFTKRGEIAIKKYLTLAKEFNLDITTLSHAFVISRPFVKSSIIGVTSIEQLRENLKALDIKLSKEILLEIENIHSDDRNPCV